ncbi:MAG: hypothetical protein ACYTEE_08025 [Planctomycetota bacterium]|jgi:hypothetical protein
MTKAIVSKVIRSVPLEGRYLFSGIRWLKGRPFGSGLKEPLTEQDVHVDSPVLYSNQSSLSVESMEEGTVGCSVDYYA